MIGSKVVSRYKPMLDYQAWRRIGLVILGSASSLGLIPEFLDKVWALGGSLSKLLSRGSCLVLPKCLPAHWHTKPLCPHCGVGDSLVTEKQGMKHEPLLTEKLFCHLSAVVDSLLEHPSLCLSPLLAEEAYSVPFMPLSLAEKIVSFTDVLWEPSGMVQMPKAFPRALQA